jgi:hypothetical protein
VCERDDQKFTVVCPVLGVKGKVQDIMMQFRVGFFDFFFNDSSSTFAFVLVFCFPKLKQPLIDLDMDASTRWVFHFWWIVETLWFCGWTMSSYLSNHYSWSLNKHKRVSTYFLIYMVTYNLSRISVLLLHFCTTRVVQKDGVLLFRELLI